MNDMKTVRTKYQRLLNKVVELTVEEEILEINNESIVQIPSFEEIKNEIAKMTDAAPGEG